MVLKEQTWNSKNHKFQRLSRLILYVACDNKFVIAIPCLMFATHIVQCKAVVQNRGQNFKGRQLQEIQKGVKARAR